MWQFYQGAYESALIAALPFLLRGAAIEERCNRKGHFSSIAALLLRRPAVEKERHIIRPDFIIILKSFHAVNCLFCPKV